MKYRFYSIKNGWKKGDIRQDYYQTHVIEDPNKETEQFVDCSGRQILLMINKESRQQSSRGQLSKTYQILQSMATTYHDWYYYPENIVLYHQTLD